MLWLLDGLFLSWLEMNHKDTSIIRRDLPIYVADMGLQCSGTTTMKYLSHVNQMRLLILSISLPYRVREFFVSKLTDIKATKADVRYSGINIGRLPSLKHSTVSQNSIVFSFSN